jgi:hypothetical protein
MLPTESGSNSGIMGAFPSQRYVRPLLAAVDDEDEVLASTIASYTGIKARGKMGSPCQPPAYFPRASTASSGVANSTNR